MKLLHYFKVYGVLNGGHLGQATAGGSGGNFVIVQEEILVSLLFWGNVNM